jgi:hypothetical protein
MQAPGAWTVTLLALLPLLGWRVYSRFKRVVGRQRLSRIRSWITLAIIPTPVVLPSVAARSHAGRLWRLAAGLDAGALLGTFGLDRTRFEPTTQGLIYAPNAHLGMALSLLFVGRVVHRLVEVYAIEPVGPHGMEDCTRSPPTLAVFGLLAGYYIRYSVGLVRWRRRVLAAKRRREALEHEARPAPGQPE